MIHGYWCKWQLSSCSYDCFWNTRQRLKSYKDCVSGIAIKNNYEKGMSLYIESRCLFFVTTSIIHGANRRFEGVKNVRVIFLFNKIMLCKMISLHL